MFATFRFTRNSLTCFLTESHYGKDVIGSVSKKASARRFMHFSGRLYPFWKDNFTERINKRHL